MEDFKKGALGGLVISILISYIFGWYDLINNNWLTGNWLKDFYKSVTYYFGWVIVYWWVYIMIGGLLFGLFFVYINYIIKLIKN